jgi:hypothetical protein
LADCATCFHPQRKEIERQAKAGVPATTLEAWTRTTEGGYVSRLALGNHLRKHVNLTPAKGRRPMSGDLAKDVVARVSERMEAGELEPNIRDGLAAAGLIDRRESLDIDRDIFAKITYALTATGPMRRQLPEPDPDVQIIESEFTVLARGGSESEAKAAAERARQRLLPATLTGAD